MAGRPKRRARLARLVHAHKRVITTGRRKCKKCGKNHTLSEHWSHTHGSHRGAHGESAWFGRKTRPQGRRKRLVKSPKRRRKAARGYTRGGVHFGPITTHRTSAAQKRHAKRLAAAHRAAYAARTAAAGRVKPKSHRVKGHLAKTPGSRKKHRVAGHMAKNPGTTRRRKGGKKPRSAAQKAATARMLAGLAAKRAGRRAPTARERAHGHKAFARAVRKGGRKKPRSAAQKAATARMLAANRSGRGRTHVVKGHLAKNPGRRGKHRVAAHIAHDPTDIRGTHRPRLG